MSSLADRLATLARLVAAGTRNDGRAVELARLGRVEQLSATSGSLTARVTSPAGSTQVAVLAPPLPDDAWQRLADGLAQSVGRLAQLAEGTLPDDALLEELLAAPLVPPVEVLRWEPDDAVLAAAVLHRLAVTADTGIVLAWRGRTANEVMADVRRARGGTPHRVAEAEVADPTRSPVGLPATRITLAPPVEPEALVRSLGPAPIRGVAGAVRAAAEFAWNLAAGAGDDALSEAVVIGELRALGTATAGELADRLGVTSADIEVLLDALHHAGTVLRAGDRYRAA